MTNQNETNVISLRIPLTESDVQMVDSNEALYVEDIDDSDEDNPGIMANISRYLYINFND